MADGFDDVDPVTADPIDREAADAEVKRLAGLDLRAYQSERKAAAKALGWQLSFLDAEVARLRPPPEPGDDAEGEAIEDVEPWPDPVDGAALADTIRNRVAGHVVFASRHDADLVALWVLGAYLADRWRLWPKLLITSPDPPVWQVNADGGAGGAPASGAAGIERQHGRDFPRDRDLQAVAAAGRGRHMAAPE